MSASNIIPKEQLSAWERWEMEAFAGGRTRGPGVHLPTVEQIEQMQHLAQSEGFDAGYREGAARARDEASRMAALLATLERQMVDFEDAVAASVLTLALRVAQSVIRSAIEARPQLLLPVVREALAEIGAQVEEKRLYLHPQDAEIVRAHGADVLQPAGWQIVEDANMARGGCRVRTSHAELDATVHTRWRRVLAAIDRSDSWLEPAPAGNEEVDDPAR